MGATRVGPQARREYLVRMRERYETAPLGGNGRPDEVCEVTRYHRKAVTRLLRWPAATQRRRLGRPVRYGPAVVGTLRLPPWESVAPVAAKRLSARAIRAAGSGRSRSTTAASVVIGCRQRYHREPHSQEGGGSV